MIPATPVKCTPSPREGVRPLTEIEMKFYKTMAEHYKIRSEENPCDRKLKQEARIYREIVASGMIGTLVGQPGNSD